MNYEIKKLNVWSVAKVSFVLGGVLGFCAGLFVWMFAGLISSLPVTELSEPEAMEGLSSLGAMMPFVLAVFYAVMLMITNGILSAVYNLLGGIVGGIELTLVAPPPPQMPMSWAPPAAPGPPPSGWPQPPAPPVAPGPPATPGG